MRGWAPLPVADSLFGLSTIWIVLWLGLAVLTIALLVLMLTSWGQSQPLRKCAVLSLFAHLLLAYLATSVKLMNDIRGVPGGGGGTLLVMLGGDADFADGQEGADAVPSQPQPWDVAGSALMEPAVAAPGRRDHEPPPAPEPTERAAQPPQKPDIAAEPAKFETTPDAPTDAAQVEPALALASVPRRSATERCPEPIEAPTPTERHADDLAVPAAAPSRVSDASTTFDVDRPAKSSAPQTFVEDAGATSAAGGGDAQAAVPTGEEGQGISSVDNRGKSGPHRVPGIYQQRLTHGGPGLLQSRGGGADTEGAVDAALRWLAANQSGDGRWDAAKHGAGRESRTLGHDRQGAGAGADTGITGLALMAYLGAGHTHRRGDHQDTVRRGLEFLLNEQATDGNLSGHATLFARTYCHGMAALALSEAYAMSGDERLLPAVKAAVAWSVAAQHPISGGWRYQAGDLGDTSQHGWQVMALRSAELAGVSVPRETRLRMVRFLNSVSAGEQGGLASYRPRQAPSRAMTAEALFCRQLLSETPGAAARQEAARYLLAETPGRSETNLYYWYYATLALYQLQGEEWDRWNAALKPALLKSQRTEGDLAGSWDIDPVWGSYGGRVYSTSLACLCLEVYYRYLPLYGEATARR